jgi:GT2 family glycosyltransferase
MLLSVIIINYKTWKLTSECIKSIYDSLGEGDDFEILLIDNGSEKDDVLNLKRIKKNNLKFIQSSENLGFARGCNLAAKSASGKVLLFLNSDTKINQGLIEMAEQLLKENSVGILGGKIISDNGEVEKSAGKFYNLWQLFLMLIGGQRMGLDRFAPEEFKKVDFVSGGFMMIKKEVFEKLSGFDEDYFMYLEDMDLCIRALKNKFETYYFPNSSVIHKQHGSSNRQFAIVNIYKSLLTFYRKNTNKLEYNIAKTMLYLKALVSYCVGLLLGKKGLAETYKEVLGQF